MKQLPEKFSVNSCKSTRTNLSNWIKVWNKYQEFQK